MNKMDSVIHNGMDAALAELSELIAIPSVSAKGQGLDECAVLVAEQMRTHGLHAEVLPTNGGPPLVFGTADSPHPDARTVLFYNHYDVQPAEPLDLWHSDPFALTVRDGKAFGRGVGDDKGHITSRLLALDAVRAENGGTLPFHVKFLAEGEEEIGSPHLGAWVLANTERLQADYCIWEEGGVDEHDAPFLYCGMRGIAYFELECETISRDAHSGMFGSLLPNAAWRLVWALSSLKDTHERILLPNHYDDAKPASLRDLELLARMPDETAMYAAMFGMSPDGFLGGRQTQGLEWQRRSVFEPTLTLCGLESGWTGQGAKTVLPARARAKMDFRLVPDQDPDTVHTNLRRYLDNLGFADVNIRLVSAQKPAKINSDHPLIHLAAQTGEEVYGKPALIAPIVGGSGPMWWFAHHLGMPVTSPGIEYPGLLAHSPNENIRLNDFEMGTRHLALLLHRLPQIFDRA
jgi:acetylornithine deacetylase/succinyl-diaminopimelate desuccinylase-like protein